MIKDRLLNLPDEIVNKKIEILNSRDLLDMDKETLKLWELDKVEIINNAVDENGKPLYSNETKRKIALENMKLEDKEYFNLNERIQLRVRNIAKLEIQLDKLFNEQGNLRAICRLEGAVNEY